ncbi:MAG: hypothetical protein ACLFUL_13215 [Desulfobacteraceae bacterium]
MKKRRDSTDPIVWLALTRRGVSKISLNANTPSVEKQSTELYSKIKPLIPSLDAAIRTHETQRHNP